jgi:hypothetical protein
MTTPASERRAGRRGSATEHGIVSARVRPGHHAVVLNLSPGGALIETSVQLRPGAPVELQLEAIDRRTVTGGRILRCAISCLASSSVLYRAAIAFDRPSSWFNDLPSGYAVPSADTASDARARVAQTQDAV